MEKVVDKKMCNSSKVTILTGASATTDTKFSDKGKMQKFVGISSKVSLSMITPRNSQLQTQNLLSWKGPRRIVESNSVKVDQALLSCVD